MSYIRQTIHGVTWVAAFRYSSRIIAIIKAVILARFFLSPYQFGLFGIVSLLLALLEILTESGINVFLVQKKDSIEEYINSAWVVSIVRGFIIALLIVVSAPFVAQFFDTEETYKLLLLVSIVPVLRGFINPAIIQFQKELRFKKEFMLRFSILTVDLFVTFLVAYFTHHASSLIWGQIAGVLVEVVLSFFFIRPHPRLVFEISKIKKIFQSGKWVTLSGLFTYLSQEGDDIVVGKLLGVSPLGYYQMAYKISTLPLTEITEVIQRVVFPIYVKISDDSERLLRAFTKTSLSVSLAAFLLGIFLYFFAEHIILLTLGTGWIQTISVLRLLIIYGVLRGVLGSSAPLFLATGRQNYLAVITLSRFFGLAITIIPFLLLFGLVGAGYASLVSVIVELPITLYLLHKVFNTISFNSNLSDERN